MIIKEKASSALTRLNCKLQLFKHCVLCQLGGKSRSHPAYRPCSEKPHKASDCIWRKQGTLMLPVLGRPCRRCLPSHSNSSALGLSRVTLHLGQKLQAALTSAWPAVGYKGRRSTDPCLTVCVQGKKRPDLPFLPKRPHLSLSHFDSDGIWNWVSTCISMREEERC